MKSIKFTHLLLGNVEVLHNNKWGAICDDEWGNEEAEVICKQLNFEGYVKHTHSAEFGLATRKLHFISV